MCERVGAPTAGANAERLAWTRAQAAEAADRLMATVRGQPLALARCQAHSIDPDQPAGLSKVTLTH